MSDTKQNFVVQNADGENLWSGLAHDESEAWELMIADTRQNADAATLQEMGRLVMVVATKQQG